MAATISSSSDDDTTSTVSKKSFLETMDLVEMPSSFIIKLHAPGIELKDIMVRYEAAMDFDFKDQMVVSVNVNRTSEELQRRYSLAEREYGHFRRIIVIPPGANEAVEPKYSVTDGVITIEVRKLKKDMLRYSSYPLTDIQELPNEQIYTMDLPGLTKEKIKLEIVNRRIRGRIVAELRVSGKWERNFDDGGGFVRAGNLPSQSFCRGYLLPESVKRVKTKNLSWEMHDGVLTLVLPKKTGRASKRARNNPPQPQPASSMPSTSNPTHVATATLYLTHFPNSAATPNPNPTPPPSPTPIPQEEQ